jgi:lysophospholipase L1-like esterase
MAGWRGVRRVSAFAVVVALVAVATGCQEKYTGLETGAKVAVIGDSISSNVAAPPPAPTSQAYDNIHRAFEPRHRVSVSGVPGTSLKDSLGRAKEYASMTPRAVVIALGTNDVTQASGGPARLPDGRVDLFHAAGQPEEIDARMQESAQALRDMLAALPGPACVVVVTVGGHPGFPWYHQVAAHWNHDVLPAAVAGDPRVHIADWGQVMDDHYAAGGANITSIDLVHLNETGQDMFAGLMVREVDACLQQTMALAQG